MKAAAKLGHERIIVLPYFLFDGVLVKRIYAAAASLARRFSNIEVLPAKYLGVHPYVADVFVERAKEGIEGKAHMNCSLCKYRVQIVGFESQLGEPQIGNHWQVKAQAAVHEPKDNQSQLAGSISEQSSGSSLVPSQSLLSPYEPHPIEARSFQLIEAGFDWSQYPADVRPILQRLVHTTGDFAVVNDIFFSAGVVDIGVRALLRCQQIVTDVTMVESGLKKSLLNQLDISVCCGVHEPESYLAAKNFNITRSAAGIRSAWQKFGNNLVLAIGDAPTAIQETMKLVREHHWRPQLVIGLPVGFVGTVEAKAELKRCLQIPRITNSGTRGGSPWAATVVNALMILALNRVAQNEF